LFTFETARSETPDNITFRLTNVIPERIIFVSRDITVFPSLFSFTFTRVSYGGLCGARGKIPVIGISQLSRH